MKFVCLTIQEVNSVLAACPTGSRPNRTIHFSPTEKDTEIGSHLEEERDHTRKLRLALEALSLCSLIELITLIVAGRGHNGEDLQAIYENSKNSYTGEKEFAIDYLYAKAWHLKEYIERGLRKFTLAD